MEATGDHYRVVSITGALPVPRPVILPPVEMTQAQRFFPALALEMEASGEFRQVVNVFISLPTVRTEAQLAIFMQTVFTLQDHYGGYLSRISFGDKGAHLLLFWGAPVAYENDVERALDFVLDLQAQTTIPINAGVTFRDAHAGHIGSPLAEEYTCYGRGVNLAARFMTAAPRDEIWVDENVYARVKDRFELEWVGERTLKGFAEPQRSTSSSSARRRLSLGTRAFW